MCVCVCVCKLSFHLRGTERPRVCCVSVYACLCVCVNRAARERKRPFQQRPDHLAHSCGLDTNFLNYYPQIIYISLIFILFIFTRIQSKSLHCVWLFCVLL